MENIIGNIDSITNKNGDVIMKSKNSIFYNSFYFQNFYDEKSVSTFIKNTERLIRQSKEYNDYLSLVKTNFNILTYDNVLSHISEIDASIEFHHYPFTLYEIVEIVMNHHFINKKNFTSFSLAKEIMELHFKHKIGFVPLTETNHQLAHNGDLFISLKQVFGNWSEFMITYNDGISQQEKDYINKLEELTTANFSTDYKDLL